MTPVIQCLIAAFIFLLLPPLSRSHWPRGLRPIACWDCGVESRWMHRCLSLVSVACSQVVVSTMGRSLVQGSPTDCGVSLCVI